MPDVSISVFISYTRTDAAFVDRLEQDLKARNCRTWVDRSELKGGQNWLDELEIAIDNCQVLLVVLSPDAVASQYVRMEYRYAQHIKKLVIPVEYRSCPKIPIDLSGIQTVDFIRSYEQGLKDIVTALNHFEKATPLLPKPLPVEASPELPEVVDQSVGSRRVGLFVDYENILPLLPAGMKVKELGQSLARHAARYGEVVCRWVAMDPNHIRDVSVMEQGLRQAGFEVQFPRGGGLRAKSSAVDFVLVERITYETAHSKPGIYMIVTGDSDYYEKIISLLEEGHTVHLVAPMSHGYLALMYRKLEEKSKQSQLPENYGFFHIEDLDRILPLKPVSRG